MKFGLVCVLMILSVDMVLGSPVNDPHWNDSNRFCGRRLAEVLQIICKGYYNEPTMHPSKRKKRGITDECCTNPCSKNYLKANYCAPDVSEEVTTIFSTEIAGTRSVLQNATHED